MIMQHHCVINCRAMRYVHVKRQCAKRNISVVVLPMASAPFISDYTVWSGRPDFQMEFISARFRWLSAKTAEFAAPGRPVPSLPVLEAAPADILTFAESGREEDARSSGKSQLCINEMVVAQGPTKMRDRASSPRWATAFASVLAAATPRIRSAQWFGAFKGGPSSLSRAPSTWRWISAWNGRGTDAFTTVSNVPGMY